MSEQHNDGGLNEATEKKIFPDWRVSGENQNLIVGLSVLVLAVGGLGLRGCSGSEAADIPAAVASVGGGDDSSAPLLIGTVPTTTTTIAPVTTTDVELTTTAELTTVPTTVATTEAAPATTAAPADLSPDVAAAVDQFPGVEGSADGTTALLTGFVDSDAQSADAETAAAAVAGIESVDNQLAAVDNGALAALNGHGVGQPVVTVSDLAVTVGGTIGSEAERQPAIDAVAAAPGVSSVVDQLTVQPSLTDALNDLVELTPIEFATGSAELLSTSDTTLDAAAKIITDAAGDSVIEVQGYTDIRGDATANLTLSDQRAAAVVAALVERGVAVEQLTSKGYGGTTKFAEGATAEAYAANRRVVFAVAQ